MRQPESSRYERPRTTCVPVIARILIGLGLLAALLALSAWTISNEHSVPQIDYCPPHDRANPWCGNP